VNREIKFRAWHRKEKVMLKPDDNYGTTRDLDCVVYYMQGQPVELMQYTGLKDKNGKEIYEGDIVKSHHFLPSEIVFTEGIFLAEDTPLLYDTLSVYPDNKWEVIGNIYENPELIGDNK